MNRCECDYDGEFNDIDFRYVKCSHYCPEHDMCESCDERLGEMRDPTFDKSKESRAMWLCKSCVEEMIWPATIADAIQQARDAAVIVR